MRSRELTESRPQRLELSESEAAALRGLGQRLVGSKTYWGSPEPPREDDDPADQRTVIRCQYVEAGLYDVVVSNAVGIVALPDLQLVVTPKIRFEHFNFLLDRSRAFPRTEEEETFAASSSRLWELVATWYASALEDVLRKGLLSDYRDESGSLRIARGRVIVADTARSFYRGELSIACDYEEYDIDMPLNRVLRAAAMAIVHVPLFSSELRTRARRALLRLDGVGALRHRDLDAELDRRSSYYGPGFVLARHVLAATGRSTESGSAEPGPS